MKSYALDKGKFYFILFWMTKWTILTKERLSWSNRMVFGFIRKILPIGMGHHTIIKNHLKGNAKISRHQLWYKWFFCVTFILGMNVWVCMSWMRACASRRVSNANWTVLLHVLWTSFKCVIISKHEAHVRHRANWIANSEIGIINHWLKRTERDKWNELVVLLTKKK